MCVFLWKPIFTGRALLPGDYLAQMAPWSSVVKADESHAPQWNPLQWDAIAQFYPWRVFYARSMKSGHIPLWNPHQFCGTPFLANGQSACLYPPNLVFLLFDPITAFTILAALHLFLAQLFMYWLMRELGARELGGIVSAVTFAFSAFMVLWLELPTFISVAVWLPLALLLVNRAVERRSGFCGMLSGLVLGLTFLAGHFQIAFYVVLATGLWWLWKMIGVWRAEGKTYTVLKVIWPLIGCVVVAGLIAAPQMLPTQELAANSHRVRAVTEEGYQAFVSNAVPVYRFVTAFVPWFFGSPSQGDYFLLGKLNGSSHVGSAADYMEYGMYAGIMPLMLALIALGSIRKKHVGFFAVLTVLALLTAAGTPINRLFYFGIPGFSALGGPNRILLLYLFGIAALAGFGIDYVTERIGEKRASRVRLTVVAAAAVLVVTIFAIVRPPALDIVRQRISMGGGDLDVVGWFCTWVFGIVFALCAAFLLARVVERRDSGVFPVAIVALVVADLFAFGINYNPTCERSKIYPKTKLTTELQRLTKNGERIAPINPKWSLFETPKDAILPPNAAMVYGLYDVQGYDSLYTKEHQSLMARTEGVDPSPPENGNMVLVRNASTSVFALARLLISRKKITPHSEQRVGMVPVLMGSVDGFRLYEFYRGYDGGSVATAGWFPALPWGIASDWRNKADWSGPNTIVFSCIPSRSQYVALNSLPYPGWIARSGHAKLRLDTHPNVRAVRALLGKTHPQRVDLSFEPFTFRFGLFLMLIGVGALSCVGVYRLQRHRIGAKR